MIAKLENLTYGYKILDGTTKEEWNSFIDDFQKHHKIRCIICNSKTSKNFRIPLLGSNIITINNKIVDDVFFLNHWF